MKMFKKYSPKSIGLIILLFLVGIGNIYAEANKKIITIKDAELWRSHSVTLADNGEWYTLLYFLTEKPDPAKENNSAKKDLKKKDKKKKETAVYGKNAQSDVLYIRRADSGK